MIRSNIEKKPFLELAIEHISTLTDVRQSHMVRYCLEEVVFLVYCGSICGMKSYEDFHDFGEEQLDWLQKYLPYEHGIPSHDTINRVLSLLNTEQLEKMLTELSHYEVKLDDGSIVNIDGKWLGRSATVAQQQAKKSDGGKQAAIMVNVYSCSDRICLASREVCSKSGEKQALEALLKMLDVSNCTLTMDAGYCHADTAKEIRARQAHYVMGLKGNQAKLHELARQKFEAFAGVLGQAKTQKKAHGREETRLCEVILLKDAHIVPTISEAEWLILREWKDLSAIIKIESSVYDTLKGKYRQECRYYISSLAMDPQKAMEVVRSHWAIENSLHWVLDVAMGEDDSTKRRNKSAQNFSIFRKIALNRLEIWDDGAKRTSIKRKQQKCLMNRKNLEKVIGFP